MENIKINTNNIKEKFKEGLESTIYYYDDEELYKNPVLYKRYKAIEYIKDYYADVSKHMSENKKNKLNLIPYLKCFKDEVKILDIGYEKRRFAGYTMLKSDLNPIISSSWINNKYNKKYLKPNGQELTLEDKIEYLKLIRNKIEKFNKTGIFIGNFNYDNFLVSNDLKNIKFCDLDNYKIDDYDFDCKTDSVKKYEEIFGFDNLDGIDSYCFNIFTLAILYDKSNFTIFRNLDSIELPEVLESYENDAILEGVKKLDKSYTPGFLIDKFK